MKTRLTGIKKKRELPKNSLIEKGILEADEVQVDNLWAILKYKDFGIMRKILCIADVLKISREDAVEEIPKDEDGRLLDKPTRNLIHNALIRKSAYEKQEQIK
jgi:hypothetical protein